MPTWNDIEKEINDTQKIDIKGNLIYDFDIVLKKYIKKLIDIRKRNVIIYYSDFLNRIKGPNIDINDSDMVGFMNCASKLDKTKGLDLILHTPGGDPTATEGIVRYLHKLFGDDIEIFVPHMAMSAGTMLACSCKCVWMGKQSSLGPIDPQFSGLPAYNIKLEFENAKKELISNDKTFEYWRIILTKYPPAMYYIACDAINLSSELVNNWLKKYMLKDHDKTKIEDIVGKLNVNTKSHNKHFDVEECKLIGLKIQELESNDDLQDAILSIYHCCTIIGAKSTACKLIINQNMKKYICHGIINNIMLHKSK